MSLVDAHKVESSSRFTCWSDAFLSSTSSPRVDCGSVDTRTIRSAAISRRNRKLHYSSYTVSVRSLNFSIDRCAIRIHAVIKLFCGRPHKTIRCTASLLPYKCNLRLCSFELKIIDPLVIPVWGTFIPILVLLCFFSFQDGKPWEVDRSTEIFYLADIWDCLQLHVYI